MKPEKPRKRGHRPIISLKVIAGDSTVYKCDEKLLKDAKDLDDIMAVIKEKL